MKAIDSMKWERGQGDDEATLVAAPSGVTLCLAGGTRSLIEGVPHLLVGSLDHAPEHGDGTREAELLREAGCLGQPVAFRDEEADEQGWAYPVLIDDLRAAVARCPAVEPWLSKNGKF